MIFESGGSNWTRHTPRLFMNKLQEKMMSMDMTHMSGGIPEKTSPYKENNGIKQGFIFWLSKKLFIIQNWVVKSMDLT